ncbi:MAG TPA: AsmA family protein [Xanthobacteraceae bacterium]|nr:AsmA family protein [Xanthobacteraceae bacterium]
MSVFGRIKRSAPGVLLLALILAGALFALPLFVPESAIRAALEQSLNAATGAHPRIEGRAHFSLLPRPAIGLESIRFDGAEAPDFSAGSLRATIRLLPLVFGRVEIDSLIFERPKLLIEIGDDGARLIGLPLQAGGSPVESRPDIKIVDGSAEVRSAGGRSETLSALEWSLVWHDSGIAARGSFQLRGVPAHASLLIADLVGLARGERSSFRFKLDSEPLRFGFEGGLAFRKGLQAEGALTVESNSLRAALAWSGIEPPTKGGFGPFLLKSQAMLTPAGLVLSALAIELDGNRAEGSLTLAQADRPLVQGTLASDSVDFSRYASGFLLKGPDGRWNKDPLDIAALTGFDLDLRLSAGRILFNKTEIERAAIAAAVRAGRFTLSVGDGQIFGGMLRASAAIGPAPAGAEIKLEASLKGFDAERGFRELADIRRLEGAGTLALTLSGNGASVNAIARDLQGRADLAIDNGAFIGVNVEQVLRRLERRPLDGMADLRGGRTHFDRFTAKLQVNEGSVSVQNAEMQNALVRVTLTGLASIPGRDLDLHGTASLVRQTADGNAGGPTFELPFLLHGSWDEPMLAPDLSALTRRSHLSPWLKGVDPTARVAARSAP